MPKKGLVPKARTFATIVFYDDALYLYGYVSFSEVEGDELYKYDLHKETWTIVTTKGNKPSLRSYHYSIIHDDKMYVIYGSHVEAFEMKTDIHTYDFKYNTWNLLEYFTGTPVGLASYVNINSTVYFLYGRDLTQSYNSIHKINLN